MTSYAVKRRAASSQAQSIEARYRTGEVARRTIEKSRLSGATTERLRAARVQAQVFVCDARTNERSLKLHTAALVGH